MSTLSDRRFRSALGRKGGYEASWVFASEIHDAIIREKKTPAPAPESPVTVFAQDVAPPQLILLPDAWVTVGKNGRPLKQQDLKMYEEPMSKKKKKKKKAKARRAFMPGDDPLSDLAEQASSSTCVKVLDRSDAAHAKEVSRGLDKKYWTRRNMVKRDITRKKALLAALLADTDAGDEDVDGTIVHEMMMMAVHKPTRNFTPLAKQQRRGRRLASAAARCYSADDQEEAAALLVDAASTAEKSVDRDTAIMSMKAKKASRPRGNQTGKASPAVAADAPSMSDKRKVEAGAASPQTTARKWAKKQSRSNCSCS